MKLRNGFVSNSSSSSFLVAYDVDPNIDIENIIVTKTINLKKDCGCIVVKTKEELDDYFEMCHYSVDLIPKYPNEHQSRIYLRSLKRLKEGKTVLIKLCEEYEDLGTIKVEDVSGIRKIDPYKREDK